MFGFDSLSIKWDDIFKYGLVFSIVRFDVVFILYGGGFSFGSLLGGFFLNFFGGLLFGGVSIVMVIFVSWVFVNIMLEINVLFGLFNIEEVNFYIYLFWIILFIVLV